MDKPAKKPTVRGNPAWFTGEVWLEPLVAQGDTSPVSINAVHFPPGARTAWHSHSKGQTLVVTEGEGRVQTRGEDAVTILPGDVTYTPADEWHWHGAAPHRHMTHLSITEGAATWGDHVSDADYHG